MLVPTNLRTNSFRVLRLSANASSSEIHKAAAAMRRSVTLGQVETTAADVPALGPVPRAPADLQSAIGRLANPSQRLEDRLFWFHSRPGPNLVANGVLQQHDDALGALLAAATSDLDAAGVGRWVRALKSWQTLVQNDDYWAATLELEDRGGFEPMILPSELKVLREGAVRLAAEALAIAGRDAVARVDSGVVQNTMSALAQLRELGPWVEELEDEIVAPKFERLQSLVLDLRKQCGRALRRVQGEGAHNKGVCDAALLRYRNEVTPAVTELLQLVPADHDAAQLARREVADCLSGIASGYTWALDFILAEYLLSEAQTLARGTLAEVEIEHGLSEVREAANKQRVWGELKPITSAPSLSTTNGFGTMLYGRSDYDPETNSYVTTYYFVALFFPVIPIARYRVIDRGGSSYSFLGQLPLRKGDRWHLGIVAAAVLLIGVATMTSRSSSSSPSTYRPTYAAPTQAAPPPAPVVAPSTPSARADQVVWRQPAAPSPAPAPKSRTQAPPVQRADSSRQSQLAAVAARLDSGRARLEVLEARLGPIAKKLASLQQRIEAISANLTEFDDQRSAGLEVDVETYNLQVENHNELLRQRKTLAASSRAEFQEYDALAQQDKELVAQYNALLK